MLTQIARSSEARKIEIRDASMVVTPKFEQTGSIGADTISSRLLDIETSLSIDSDADPQSIAKLVTTAERMCFLMDTIREPHEVRNTLTLNGQQLDY